MKKSNFKHIAVRGETRDVIDKYLEDLAKIYNKPTYDELIRIFLAKHKNLSFNEKEIQMILWDSKRRKG